MTDRQPEPTTEAGRDEERLGPEELAYLRGNDEGYRRGYAHAMRDRPAIEAEARADERERLAGAVRTLPRIAMIGGLTTRQMVTDDDGPYLNRAAVLALLQPDTAP